MKANVAQREAHRLSKRLGRCLAVYLVVPQITQRDALVKVAMPLATTATAATGSLDENCSCTNCQFTSSLILFALFLAPLVKKEKQKKKKKKEKKAIPLHPCASQKIFMPLSLSPMG